MSRNILWILLAAAPLVSASSLGFQANCSGTTCSGSYNGNAFVFTGPFPGGGERVPINFDPNFPYNPFIDFSIGTNGGSFTVGGNTCDYGVILGGGNCYGEAAFGANIGPPDETGHKVGDVVSVSAMGTAEGWFCWDGACPSGGPPPPLFNVNVLATYQFTLTDPGTVAPFTWTGAQFSAVPEPGTLLFAILGLAGAGIAGYRRRNRIAG